MPEQSLSNTCVFFLRSIRAFLHLATLDNNLPVCLGVILNSEIIEKKHKNGKILALNNKKDACFFCYEWKLKQESGSPLFDISWIMSVIPPFCLLIMSPSYQKTTNHKYWSEGSNRNLSQKGNSQIQNLWKNENPLYMFYILSLDWHFVSLEIECCFIQMFSFVCRVCVCVSGGCFK